PGSRMSHADPELRDCFDTTTALPVFGRAACACRSDKRCTAWCALVGEPLLENRAVKPKASAGIRSLNSFSDRCSHQFQVACQGSVDLGGRLSIEGCLRVLEI